jgi:hypothetical protein
MWAKITLKAEYLTNVVFFSDKQHFGLFFLAVGEHDLPGNSRSVKFVATYVMKRRPSDARKDEQQLSKKLCQDRNTVVLTKSN